MKCFGLRLNLLLTQEASKQYEEFIMHKTVCVLIVIPEQELILEHTPSLRTVPSLQKQPLVQGVCSLHLLTPVMLLQDRFQLQSWYSFPAGQAMYILTRKQIM